MKSVANGGSSPPIKVSNPSQQFSCCFLVLTHASPSCKTSYCPQNSPPSLLDPKLNCFSVCIFPSFMCFQAWQSGRLGSTSTILEGTGIMSAWRRFVSITGREFVYDLQPWRLAPLTGWLQQTRGKWFTPVWRRASGALTRNNPRAASAPTIMSAFSVPQVAL